MKGLTKKETIFKIFIVIAVFWILDFIFHVHGVGETVYYYFLKFGNATLFSLVWFSIFNSKEHYKKIIYSVVFGTWISFTYLITSYSGLVQFFGISAYSSPPPFIIFGITLSPLFWWVFHILAFYLALEVSEIVKEKKRKR